MKPVILLFCALIAGLSFGSIAFSSGAQQDILLGGPTVLSVPQGGTSVSSTARGSILYGASSTAFSNLTIGSTGQVLTVSGGLPVWGNASGSDFTFTNHFNQKVVATSSPVYLQNTLFASSSVYISASSTTAVPLSVFDETGRNFFSVASTSARALVNDEGTEESLVTKVYGLKLGSPDSHFAGITLQSPGGSIIDMIRNGLITMQLGERTLILTDTQGTTTGTYSYDRLYLNRTLTNKNGMFAIEPTGSVSASGTLNVASTTYLNVIQANSSAGITLKANNASNVALFGAGGGTNFTFYGAGSVASSLAVGGAQHSGAILEAKGTTNDGSTYIFHGHDSDEAWRFSIDTDGNTSVSGTLKVYGGITFPSLPSCGTLQTDTNGALSCGTSATFDGRLSGNIFQVTDGVTTSTMTANSLNIATSTVNMLGLFSVDSSGNVSASGTLDVFGLVTTRDGLKVNGAAAMSSTLQVTGTSTLYSRLVLPGLGTVRPLFFGNYTDGHGIGISAANTLCFYVAGSCRMQITNLAVQPLIQLILNSSLRFGSFLSVFTANQVAMGPVTGQGMTTQISTTYPYHTFTFGSNDILGQFRPEGLWLPNLLQSATSTISSSTLNIYTTSSSTAGVFSVNQSGNVSASGTLYSFGNFTSLLMTSSTSSTISNGGAYTNKVVCYVEGGGLGHCTSAVDGAGACTCISN